MALLPDRGTLLKVRLPPHDDHALPCHCCFPPANLPRCHPLTYTANLSPIASSAAEKNSLLHACCQTQRKIGECFNHLASQIETTPGKQRRLPQKGFPPPVHHTQPHHRSKTKWKPHLHTYRNARKPGMNEQSHATWGGTPHCNAPPKGFHRPPGKATDHPSNGQQVSSTPATFPQ